MAMQRADMFGGEMNAAREKWQEEIWTVKGGVICPCCDRMGKVYAHRFTPSMARSLVFLYRAKAPGSWIHTPSMGDRTLLTVNNVGYLEKWGLTESMPTDPDSEKASSGIRRVTELGMLFVSVAVSIPEYIFTYDNKRIAQSPLSTRVVKDITIRQAGGRFDIKLAMTEAINFGKEK